MWRIVGNPFRARAVDGREFRLVEEVEILDDRSFDNPRAKTEGLRRLTTTERHHVNRINDNEFDVLGAGPLLETIRVKRAAE
jgi:hypothetical protein